MEKGFSQSNNKYFTKVVDSHFITEDLVEPLDLESQNKMFMPYQTKLKL